MKRKWGIIVTEPDDDMAVPTLIQNPRWIRIIEPVLDFMGILPGYREFDVSFWFLVSLSLFFAMLVGDGGYGLLFLAGTILARKRFRDADPEPFVLLTVFSLSTIIWGLATGTWFGSEPWSNLPVLKRLVVPSLNSYSDNQTFMLQLCFTLGAIHLSIAHVIRAIRLAPSPSVVAELGWLLILWFLYFLAGNLVLGKAFPGSGLPLLILGTILVSIFTKPEGFLIKSTLIGLANLPLDFVRSFSDLVSYLRLFAVGYATLVLAVSFNQMAADLGRESMFHLLGAVMILLVGHAMNIALALMAVLVHGIRLNMLEFSSHLGMNWTGAAYRPFKRTTPGSV